MMMMGVGDYRSGGRSGGKKDGGCDDGGGGSEGGGCDDEGCDTDSVDKSDDYDDDVDIEMKMVTTMIKMRRMTLRMARVIKMM